MWTAIIWASDRQQLEAVKLLHEKGAFIQGCAYWAREPPLINFVELHGGHVNDSFDTYMVDAPGDGWTKYVQLKPENERAAAP